MEDLLEEIGKELPPARAKETYSTLNKVFGNIAQNPSEQKYRSLKKTSKLLSEKILVCDHAVSLLLATGFEDRGEAFVLPADADLEPLQSSVDLIACILVSMEDIEPEVEVPDAKATGVAAVTTAKAPAVTKSTVVEQPQGFKRRDDVEAKRQEQMDQLQAARNAKRGDYQENPKGPVYVPPATQNNGYPTSAESTAAKKKVQAGAFDFQDRGKKEREKAEAEQSLQDIRRAQKEKFKDFQSDPNAKQQEAYKQPPSVAGNATTDSSWGGWFGGMFGGSSSNSTSKPEKPERRGPNIKGVGDLPKPVRRG